MKKFYFLSVILLSLLGKQESILAQAPDIILINGKIFTSDTAQLYVEALAIKGNKIQAIGSNTSISKLATSTTKKIDLKGKTVVPGFNDAHDHPGWGAGIGKAFTYSEYNSDGLSKIAVLDSIYRLVKLAKPNQWISGPIGTAVFFDKSMRDVLDKIAPENPVMLQVWWGHGLVVNANALEVAGISDDDADPVGGWYERAADSNKIYALQQNAQVPVWQAYSSSEPENLVKELQSYANQQLPMGITTVQFMSTGLHASDALVSFNKANLQQRIRTFPGQKQLLKDEILQIGIWNLPIRMVLPIFLE